MNIGDWQIADISGANRFLLYQVGEDDLLHYKGSLSHNDEIQHFVKDHALILMETLATCPSSTRNYSKSGQTDQQASIYVEVERYRKMQSALCEQCTQPTQDRD